VLIFFKLLTRIISREGIVEGTEFSVERIPDKTTAA